MAYLFRSDWLLAGLMELLDGLLVVTEILLTSYEDDGETLTEVEHFGDPLCRAPISKCLSWGRRLMPRRQYLLLHVVQ